MNRWWIYQKERFPIAKNGLLMAGFSASAIGYSLLLKPLAERAPMAWGLVLLAALALFLFLLQLRIVDEFKAIQEDVLFHPERPVPRGLVTLPELKMIGFAAGLIQFGLALTIGLPMVLLLMLLWAYLGFIAQNFAAPWFKRPRLRLLSNAAFMPLLGLYATAHDWLTANSSPAKELIWFLLISLLSGLAIEIAHKIYTPKGLFAVKTSSGEYRQAVLVWLTVVWLMALTTLQAGVQVHFVVPTTIAVLTLLTASVLVAWWFWANPVAAAAKQIKLMTGLWLAVIYCNIGILPLMLSQFKN